jgi:hypothetical protein
MYLKIITKFYFLTRKLWPLYISVRNLLALWLSSPKNLNNKIIFLPPNHLPTKNQENPSDGISYTWASLIHGVGGGGVGFTSPSRDKPNSNFLIRCLAEPVGGVEGDHG